MALILTMSSPIARFRSEWSAPERLALASRLHGGPRPPLDGCRVLELGCGNGANLLPLAYRRRHAGFVGARRLAERSRDRAGPPRGARSGQSRAGSRQLPGGRRSARGGSSTSSSRTASSPWVPDETRDALFALCADRLRPGGLLYPELQHEARLERARHGEGLVTRRDGRRRPASKSPGAPSLLGTWRRSSPPRWRPRVTTLTASPWRTSSASFATATFRTWPTNSWPRTTTLLLAPRIRRSGARVRIRASRGRGLQLRLGSYSRGLAPSGRRRQVFWASRPTTRSIRCPSGSRIPRS